MINIRYHLVSIVAVFLALGIGIALGTSFIDGVIVDRLERSINDLQSQSDSDADEISGLNDEVESREARFEAFGEALIVGGYSRRLTDVPVMILTAEGVEDDEIEPIRRALVRSGAVYEGILRLSSELDLDDDGDRARLAEVLGLVDDDLARVQTDLSDRMRRLFAPPELPSVASVTGQRLGEAAAAVSLDPTEPGLDDPETSLGPGDDLLARLAEAGLAEFDSAGAAAPRLSSVPRVGSRFVFVSGPAMAPASDTLIQTMVLEMLRVDPAPFVVASTASPVEDDPFLELFRTDAPLAGRVSTIDDAGSHEGVAATVMAADRIGDLDAEDYGKRPDTATLLPRR